MIPAFTPNAQNEDNDETENRQTLLNNIFRYLPWAFLVLALIVHLHYVFVGWSLPISGQHDFRQAQTALSTFYFVNEGWALDYKLPLFGPTWRLPFEFPTYQALVAILHQITGLPLDQAGRTVGIIAFLLTLIVLFYFLKEIELSQEYRCYILGLIALNPMYIFWSRAFLIESVALLLSTTFATLTIIALTRSKYKRLWISTAILFGCLAAVTKFTTFSIFLGFILLWYGVQVILPFIDKKCSHLTKLRWLTMAGLLLISVSAGIVWSQFVDASWGESPLAQSFQQNVHSWNFGTWEQRLDREFWGGIYDHALRIPFGSILPLLIGMTFWTFGSLRSRLLCLALFSSWISGFLVWANLFYIHDYYHYETTLFLIIWFVATAAGTIDRLPLLRAPVILILILFGCGEFIRYRTGPYFQHQLTTAVSDRVEFGKKVAEYVEPNSVLLIVGEGWNPMIPYYAERYAIMPRWEWTIEAPEFKEAVKMMQNEGKQFGGLIYCRTPGYEKALETAINTYGFNADPALLSSSHWHRLYLPSSLTPTK